MRTKIIKIKNNSFNIALKLFVIFILLITISLFKFLPNQFLTEKDFIYVANPERFRSTIKVLCTLSGPLHIPDPHLDEKSGELIYESTELIPSQMVAPPRWIPENYEFKEDPKQILRNKITLPIPEDNFDKVLNEIENLPKNSIANLESSIWVYVFILETGEVWKAFSQLNKNQDLNQLINQKIKRTKFIPSMLRNKALNSRAYLEINLEELKNSI